MSFVLVVKPDVTDELAEDNGATVDDIFTEYVVATFGMVVDLTVTEAEDVDPVVEFDS